MSYLIYIIIGCMGFSGSIEGYTYRFMNNTDRDIDVYPNLINIPTVHAVSAHAGSTISGDSHGNCFGWAHPLVARSGTPVPAHFFVDDKGQKLFYSPRHASASCVDFVAAVYQAADGSLVAEQVAPLKGPAILSVKNETDGQIVISMEFSTSACAPRETLVESGSDKIILASEGLDGCLLKDIAIVQTSGAHAGKKVMVSFKTVYQAYAVPGFSLIVRYDDAGDLVLAAQNIVLKKRFRSEIKNLKLRYAQ